MPHRFGTGQTVSWTWRAHDAHGHIVERFEWAVQRTIEGARIVRRGSAENPPYLVITDEGRKALKRGSGLTAA